MINKCNCNINDNFCFNLIIFIEFLYFNFIVVVKRKINKKNIYFNKNFFTFYSKLEKFFFLDTKNIVELHSIKDILRHQIFINGTYINIYLIL